jgi:hypothetical protein
METVPPRSLVALLHSLGLPPEQLELSEATRSPVWGIPVPASQAERIWHAARKPAQENGFTPILLTSEEATSMIAEETAEQVLSLAEQVNVQEWIQDQIEEWNSMLEEDGDDPLDLTVDLDNFEESDGAYTIYSLSQLGQDAAALLAFLPTAQPWQALAYYPFGSWNDCPADEVHTAFLHMWYERWGAVPMVVTHDVLELWVDRPPQTPKDAAEVAVQQYLYCIDIVDQGTETVHALAETLLNSPVWFFWWD